MSQPQLIKFKKPANNTTSGLAFDVQPPFPNLVFQADQYGNVVAIPVVLVDPGQANQTPLGPGTIVNPSQDTLLPTNFWALATLSFKHVFDGTNWQRERGAAALDSGVQGATPTAHVARIASVPAATVITQTLATLQDLSSAQVIQTSAVATAQTIIIDSRNLSKTLAIQLTASAGAPTFSVSGSADNATYIVLDTGLAVGVKQYVEGTLGATVALSPLSFRYIKIIATSAGGGNTSTLHVGMK